MMPFVSSMMLTEPTGSVGSAWSPSSLFGSGEKGFVYDPTDPTHLRQDYAGTTPVTASGDPVGYIADLSPNGNHLRVQDNETNRRALYDVEGGVPSLLFDGVDDVYDIPSTTETGMTAGMFLYAAKRSTAFPPTSGGESGPVIGQTGSYGGTLQDAMPWTDRVIYHGFMSSARKTLGPATAPDTMLAWHDGEFRSAANDWRHYINGELFYSTTTNTVATHTNAVIGGHQESGGFRHWKGRIGRMVMIDRILTATEIENVRKWLAAPIYAAITDLAARVRSDTWIRLVFTPSTGVFEYRLNGGTPAILPANRKITGLSASTSYTVEVRALSPSGPAAWSNPLSVTTRAFSDNTATVLNLFSAGEMGMIIDPTDITTLSQDINGLTPVTASGDPIGRIEDLSGNRMHPTVTGNTAARRAVYNVVSGVEAILFDGSGTGDSYDLPWAIAGTEAQVFYGLRINAHPNADAFQTGSAFCQSGTSVNADHEPFTDNNVYHGFHSTVRKSFAMATPSLASQWRYVDIRSKDGQWAYAVDGIDRYTTTTNTFSISAFAALGRHIRNQGSDGIKMSGRLGRVVYINRILTGTELAAVRAWITEGWA